MSANAKQMCWEDSVPRLSVIVPVYNEAATAVRLVQRVLAASRFSVQVIVVDDGSTDGSWAALGGAILPAEVELVHHARNCGKGAAIRTGLARACGQFALIQDADLEYGPEDYPVLLEPLLAGTADVVYGSRYLRPKILCSRHWCFRLGVKTLNLWVRLLYGVRLTDEGTCYKVFPTEVLRAMELECERFEFCPEVTAKAIRMGLRIAEVPIRYTPRTRKEGKKIRWGDGLVALWTLWRWRNWRPRMDVRGQQSGRAAEGTMWGCQTAGEQRSAPGHGLPRGTPQAAKVVGVPSNA